jgi:hypothetical protein
MRRGLSFQRSKTSVEAQEFTLYRLPRFELTPKALANFSPGFEQSENPGIINSISVPTLKGFGSWRTLSGLEQIIVFAPGLSLRSNSGLKLANAFGVNSN